MLPFPHVPVDGAYASVWPARPQGVEAQTVTRIKLKNLRAEKSLSVAEMRRAEGGYYSLFAGAILAYLAIKYRKQIWQKIKPTVTPLVPSSTARPQSSICVTWYGGERDCY